MTTPTLAIAGLRGKSARLLIPWRGAWLADFDFDINADHVVPSGRVELVVGKSTLAGTVDANGAGRFGEYAKASVLAGAGGWQKTVTPRHFKNDAGVRLKAVVDATLAEIGETVASVPEKTFGADYARAAGPASRILEGLDWHVRLDGVTELNPWPTTTKPAALEVLSYDPESRAAQIASDDVVLPGTVITDSRFGTLTVREVEQTFDDSGVKATAWCGDAPNVGLANDLVTFVREKSGMKHSRAYRFRVVVQEGERLTLQAVDSVDGMPDMRAIEVWPGVPGVTATHKPGSIVLVEFPSGDPGKVVVRSFGPGKPLALKLDADTIVGIGGAGATHPAAKADAMLTWVAELLAQIATAVGGAGSPAGAAAAATAFTAAMVTPTANLTANMPSAKLLTE